MDTKDFIEKAIAGGWMNDSVRQAIFMFGHDGYQVFANGFGWVILHDKNEKNDGGLFQSKSDSFRKEQVFLDPLAWQAVGKVEGWAADVCDKCGATYGDTDCPMPHVNQLCTNPTDGWLYWMHRMIDALAEGKTIEEFLKTL